MGGLSDYLGGKRAPPPPPQLRESAEAAFDLAEGFRPRIGRFRGAADDFISNYLQRYSGQVAGDFDTARDTSINLGDDYANLFGDYGAPVLAAAGNDALVAGSEARQEDEGRRAYEAAITGIDAAKLGRQQELFRRGRAGGGADSAHLAVMEGAMAGAAANNARLAERNYGERFRQGFVPVASGFGDSALNYDINAGNLSQMAADGRLMMPRLAGQLYSAEGALTGQNQAQYGSAQQMFGNSYRADLMKAQADSKRKMGIWKNGLDAVMRVGAAVATGGMSEAGRAMGGVGGGDGAGVDYSSIMQQGFGIGMPDGYVPPVETIHLPHRLDGVAHEQRRRAMDRY